MTGIECDDRIFIHTSVAYCIHQHDGFKKATALFASRKMLGSYSASDTLKTFLFVYKHRVPYKKLLGQPLTCNNLTEDSRKRVSYIVSYDMLLLMGMWMKESEFHVVCTSDKRIVERMDLFVLCDNVLCDMLNQIIANR